MNDENTINLFEILEEIQKSQIRLETKMELLIGPDQNSGIIANVKARITRVERLVWMGLGIFSLLAVASPFIARAIWH